MKGVIIMKIKNHILVCTSCRINGQQKGYCFQKDSVKVINKFMEEIDDRDLSGDVLVTNTGCFGICEKGPVVVIYPEGVWYRNVSVDDVTKIMDVHIEGGGRVEELLI